MKKIVLAISFVLLLLSGCKDKAASGNTEKEWTFHTTPDKWEKPRLFQTPFDEQWADRITIERVPLKNIEAEKTFSPNKAYWFYEQKPDTMKPGPYELSLDIYNERDYLIKLKIMEVYGNFITDAKWINEKIVYVRAWWGRVLGFDLLFDVESEKIIYKENVNDGGIPFMQWQQAKQENK
jgi:hypothetical protein